MDTTLHLEVLPGRRLAQRPRNNEAVSIAECVPLSGLFEVVSDLVPVNQMRNHVCLYRVLETAALLENSAKADAKKSSQISWEKNFGLTRYAIKSNEQDFNVLML